MIKLRGRVDYTEHCFMAILSLYASDRERSFFAEQSMQSDSIGKQFPLLGLISIQMITVA